MFVALRGRFANIFDKMKQKGVIAPKDLDIALREIRISMLEADVALSVTKQFIHNIKNKALGNAVINSVTPGQMIVKIVHDELTSILGDDIKEISFKSSPPAVFILAGLQGVGKTTTAAKLVLHLRTKYKKKVLLASLDTYRPAAQEQLAVLSKQVSIESLSIIPKQIPLDIATRALDEGKSGLFDVVVLDTAGRLHSDSKLIREIINIKKITNPIETLLVADSMAGQDAVNSAKHFHDKIHLSGVILTRIDGDSRGGAALSIKYVTGCPIKFIGYGEKILDFAKFHPDRIASRILDMGDVVTLVERAIDTVNVEEEKKLVKKMQKGNFDMEDLRKQLKNLKKMGSLSSILSMLPGCKEIKKTLGSKNFDNNIIIKQEAIIDSMTRKEKMLPKIMNASRKNRVAKGAGVTVQEINKLIKQFLEVQKMMKKIKRFDTKFSKGFENILEN